MWTSPPAWDCAFSLPDWTSVWCLLILSSAKRQPKILHRHSLLQTATEKKRPYQRKSTNTESAPFLDIMYNVTKTLHHCCFNQRKILLRVTFLCIDHCSEHEILSAQLKLCFLYVRGIAWKIIKD